jgi:anti-sigma regulatory factor (Ser/Thr protein kinase)
MTSQAPAARAEFRHEAFLYAGEDEFLAGSLSFLRASCESEEAALVVVSAEKIRALEAELDGDAGRIYFADMAEVGSNPARIIPAWRDFLLAHGADGRSVRGIGEPVWAGRTPDELVECQRHEELLNVAFSGGTPWWLLCPYDTAALDPDVVEEARRSHPFVWHDDVHAVSPIVRGLEDMAQPSSAPLPNPPGRTDDLSFETPASLFDVRRFVAERARHAGLDPSRTAALVLAADEVAANSVRHGGGGGTLRVWRTDDDLVCEVRDEGQLSTSPLIGRELPAKERVDGRGLWLVNQVCDLVQVRSFSAGCVFRLVMHLDLAPE